jgi:glycerol transport system ATP-binding protein
MARIELDRIGHAYTPDVPALKPLTLTFEDGGAYALLGPSGCGKTTLLNIVSGLISPSEGRLRFDGRDVTDEETQARNIAQVFQFPVVYDAMTVSQNLAFPLRNRKLPRAAVAERVETILKLLDLEAWADRKARGLTADLKQKISLGRGLVRTDVGAILFDEPLTVIDPEMKWRLRSQLKALHRETGRTMIYVTHDQTEALTFADQVLVMHEGQVVQQGTPAELFETPRHTFVGYFIGSPGMNLLPVEIAGAEARFAGHLIPLAGTPKASGPAELGVRPEHVRLGREGLPVTVSRVEDLGRLRIVRARLETVEVAIVVGEAAEIPAEPRISFDPARTGVFVDGWRVEMQVAA